MNKYEQSIELESILVREIRPHFLKIDYQEDYFHVVLCHPKYTNLSIGERIGNIYSLLKVYCNDILNNNIVIIEVFSPDEMNDLFEFWL